MSAEQTPTRKRITDLQVGDILALAHQGDEVSHGALITNVDHISFQATKVRFLVQPAGEAEVKEVEYAVNPQMEVEVL